MTRAKDISKIVSDANFGGTLDVGGAFTSLGIDDNANATAITIDSSENVMVGTTTILTAESNVEGISLASGSYGGLLSVSRASARSATFNRKTNDGDIVEFRKDGTVVGSIFSGHGGSQVGIGINTTGITFNPSTRSMMPANPSSTSPQLDATLDIGFSSVRWKDLYLSGGAFLGGTGTANKLEDYEEGTWTPVFQVANSTTYSTQIGTYIKVGKQVQAYFHINANVNQVGNTGLRVGGLPFTAINNTSGSYGGTSGIHCNSWSNGDNKPDNGLIAPNNSHIDLYHSQGTTGTNIPTGNNINQGSLIGVAIYRAT